MSQLQKKIVRVQRREATGGMGFGAVAREQPRAMLLAVVAADVAGGKQAAEAGADVVLVRSTDADGAVATIEAVAPGTATVGAWLDSLDEAAAESISKAGCDFVVSTIEGTASAAVNTDRMGHMLVATEAMDDTTLRSLGPLGLDGLLVERPSGDMTLAQQIGLVRISSFSGSPLMVTIDPEAKVSDLRVLRDSGAAIALIPAGTSADRVKALIEALKAVPAQRKGKNDGREMAIVPSVAAAHNHAEEEDGDDDDE